jgi:membrane-associated phospholipid phosphatase
MATLIERLASMRTRTRWVVLLAIALAGMLLATELDAPAFRALRVRPTQADLNAAAGSAAVGGVVGAGGEYGPADATAAPAVRAQALAVQRLEGYDWFRLQRLVGYLPTWLFVALTVLAAPGPDARVAADRLGRFVYLVGAVTLSGVAAEFVKMVVMRQRPGADGEYVFRPLFSGFVHGTSHIGMPSSHAAVAFAAAVAMGLLYPRTRLLMLLLAAGCAWTRLATGAHFLSDVFAAMMIGVCVPFALAGVLLERGAGTAPKV